MGRRSTKCCWRPDASRSSTMRPSWRAGSACLSSPGTPISIPPVQRTGRRPRPGCRRTSAGGRAACCRRRRPRPRHSFTTWRRCRAQGIDVVIGASAARRCGARGADAAASGSTGRCVACCARSRRARPARRLRPGRRLRAGAPVGLLIGGFTVLPDATLAALTALIALPFLCVTALRLVALRQALASPASKVRGGNPDARSRPAAACLYRPGAGVPRSQRAARPDPVAAGARLSAGQARDLPGPRDRRHRDPGGGVRDWRCPAISAPGRAGRRPANQAQGAELCAAVRARRLRRGLRCRGSSATRPAAARVGRILAVASPASPACRRSSTSTIRARAGSPDSSPSNIPRCSTPSCRRSRSCGCRCRWAAPRTISRAPRCSRSAAGTPTM